jgi:hypothetical protein
MHFTGIIAHWGVEKYVIPLVTNALEGVRY